MEQEIHYCRICKSSDTSTVLDLGRQVITSRFPEIGDNTTPTTKIRLMMCNVCHLVQLKDTTASSELYEHMYGYRSGLNEMMCKHLKDYNNEIKELITLNEGDTVLDIGSNDATFLKFYDSKLNRIGCDPTGSQFKQFYTDSINLIPTYFTHNNFTEKMGTTTKCKVVTSISMFYDLPDPVQFAHDIYSILDDNGIWSLEQSYVLTMLERNSIDTICHEHIEYYGVKQIKEIMDRAGFKIIKLGTNDCNGGSFRIYVAKKTSNFTEITNEIRTYIDKENAMKIHTHEAYVQFRKRCELEVNKLKYFIQSIKENGKKVYIYGASTKGNCLLQFANIDSSIVPYAVERNPLKFGKMTSTGIPIISEEQMRKDMPDYLLVLPWHFKDGIIQREAEYINSGGKLLFPFPTFSMYSNKKSVIITGSDGQIANYLIPKLKTFDIYGITNTLQQSKKSVHSFKWDESQLENILLLLNPVYIIHLASMSNTEDCENNPIKTIEVNGMISAIMCDIIYRHKLDTKLFNASSSELYKNHITYTVKDDDDYMLPGTMYAIAKNLAHNFVNYYRTKYSMPFSNGVIFTTESYHRKSSFLFKKVSTHASTWKTSHTVLSLGSLSSYRNIIHADDVAQAIITILTSTNGGTFNICNSEAYLVEDIVIKIYKLFDIELIKVGNNFIDKATNLPVIQINGSFRGTPTNISGDSSKLKALGWIPKHTIDDILNDIAGLKII